MEQGVLHSDEITLSQQRTAKSTLQAWVVCMTAALFFFYDFIQMNLFSVINVPLMQEFHLTAAQLGSLSAYFFVANALFLIPVGTILDRVSTKKTILYTLMIGIGSMLALSYVHSLALAKLFRFTSGITSAFCFLACVRLTSRWFPPRRFAMVMGFVVMMAMIGGVVAQTPAALLVQHFTWRPTLRIDAAFGLFILLLCFCFIKDYPPGSEQMKMQSKTHFMRKGFISSTIHAIFRWQVWFAAIYTCLMNLPICVLGGVWGTLYLRYAHHLPMVNASGIVAFLFFGTIVGSPLCGWISDRIGQRRLPMLIGVVLSIIFFIPLLWQVHFSYAMLLLLFFLVGLTTSTQILSYPFVSEISPIAVTATAVSVVSFVTIGSLSFFQPLFGQLVDYHASIAAHSTGVYHSGDYFYAMWLFPVSFIVALIAAFFIKESYCRRSES